MANDCQCKEITASHIAKDLAPCGISCGRCAMYAGGDIKRLSLELNYPCSQNRFPPDLESAWRERNDRIREVGLEQYYDEQAGRPRY